MQGLGLRALFPCVVSSMARKGHSTNRSSKKSNT